MSIIEMSVTGGIMILTVIVMHALGVNKLPKRAFIVMWEIVLLRLLLPVSIPLPILPAVEVPSITVPSANYGDYAAPSLFMPNYDINVPDEYIPEQTAPIVPPQPHAVAEPSAQIQPTVQTPAPKLHISLGAVYAVGASALALFFVLSYVHGIKKFRTSLPVESDYVSDWLYVHKGGKRISVRYSDRISSPLTYGILKPVILLPKDTDLSDQKLLAYILEHEYAHIRHFDSIKKLIAALALCLHWFNPLVWAMYMLYNRDIELWCDECVVRRFGEKSRANYARMLITMEELKSGAPLMSYFRRNSVEERIISIMKFKKTTIISAIVAALLIAAITITIIATSVTPVPKEAEDNTSNAEAGSFPINVFIDSETSQKYYAVHDKYAVAIAPEDEEIFSSGEYSMTPEELDEWVHREFDRILGLTEGKMFYDSAANMLVEYDAIGDDGVCDTLNYRVAESLGATVGIVAAPVFTVPVNLVFTERYVTPGDGAAPATDDSPIASIAKKKIYDGGGSIADCRQDGAKVEAVNTDRIFRFSKGERAVIVFEFDYELTDAEKALDITVVTYKNEFSPDYIDSNPARNDDMLLTTKSINYSANTILILFEAPENADYLFAMHNYAPKWLYADDYYIEKESAETPGKFGSFTFGDFTATYEYYSVEEGSEYIKSKYESEWGGMPIHAITPLTHIDRDYAFDDEINYIQVGEPFSDYSEFISEDERFSFAFGVNGLTYVVDKVTVYDSYRDSEIPADDIQFTDYSDEHNAKFVVVDMSVTYNKPSADAPDAVQPVYRWWSCHRYGEGYKYHDVRIRESSFALDAYFSDSPIEGDINFSTGEPFNVLKDGWHYRSVIQSGQTIKIQLGIFTDEYSIESQNLYLESKAFRGFEEEPLLTYVDLLGRFAE